VAGVFLDLMKQIESQLLMREYDGFKVRSRSSMRRLGGARGPAQGGRAVGASRVDGSGRR
jgi:hypothetical protein